MKKQFIFCLVFFSFLKVSVSQKYSVSVELGYGNPFYMNLIGYNTNETFNYTPTYENINGATYKFYNLTSIDWKEKAIFGSYAAGFSYGVSFQRALSEKWNAEISFNYLKGKGVSFKDSRTYVYKDIGLGLIETINEEYKPSLISLSPKLEFKIATKPNWYTYIKAGFVVGFPMLELNLENRLDYPYFNDTLIKRTYEYKPSFSLGYSVSLGFSAVFYKNVWYYLEIGSSYLHFRPDAATLRAYTINSEDWMEEATANEKERIYSEEATSVSPEPVSSVSKRSFREFDHSHWSIQAGLRVPLKFTNKSKSL